MRFWQVAVTIVPLIVIGCTHHQLRWNTVKQAKTVSDVHTQQVLDNLAKFAENQGALAHFSWPNAGSSRVTDEFEPDGRLTWNPFGLTSAFLNLGGSRQSMESWTMTPINDAKKLELMSCAYQRAVSNCCGCDQSSHCPNCEKLFNKFYLGEETPREDTYLGKPLFRVKPSVCKIYFRMKASGYCEIKNTQLKVYSDDCDSDTVVYRLATETTVATVGTLVYSDASGKPLSAEHLDRMLSENLAEYTTRTGRTTAECLRVPCWFRVGCRPEIPKDCRYVGRHRGTYVRVPESGVDRLTALTLTILDIAQNDPPRPRTKEVEVYLDKTGALANGASKAAYKVSAKIPFKSDIATVVSPNTIDRTIKVLDFQAQKVETSKAGDVKKVKKNELSAASQSLRDQREGLDAERQSLQFLPPIRTPVPNAGYLEFQQNLDALAPNDSPQ